MRQKLTTQDQATRFLNKESALIDSHTCRQHQAWWRAAQCHLKAGTLSTALLSTMTVPPPPTSGPSRTPTTGSAVLISAATHAPSSIRSPHGPGETTSETLGSTAAHPPSSIHSRNLSMALGAAAETAAISTTDVCPTRTSGLGNGSSSQETCRWDRPASST
jgi:hypothetical protein